MNEEWRPSAVDSPVSSVHVGELIILIAEHESKRAHSESSQPQCVTLACCGLKVRQVVYDCV